MSEQDAAKFLKVYANLPIGLRSDIVAVLDDVGPVSWNAAYVEISNRTALGGQILSQLTRLEII